METILAREDVLTAMTGQGINNPVYDLLKRYQTDEPHKTRMDTFFAGYVPIDHGARHEYAKTHFGFFADDVEGVGDFSVEPLEIIAMWNTVADFKIFPEYLASRVICVAYASLGLPEDRRSGVTRYMVEQRNFPESYFTTIGDVRTFEKRLERIKANTVFTFCSRDVMQEMIKAVKLSDVERVNAIMSGEDEKLRKKLSLISENFTTGLAQINFALDRVQMSL